MKKRSHALDLEIKRIDLLYRQTRAGIISTAACGVAFIYLAWPTSSHTQLISWGLVLLTVAALRATSTLRWDKAKHHIDTAAGVHRWHLLISVHLFATGLCWGYLGWVSFGPTIPREQEIFAALLVMGLSAGAVVNYAPSSLAMLSYLLPAVLPWSARLFDLGDRAYVTIGLTSLLFLVLMVKMARNLNAFMRASFATTARLHENQERLRLARDSSAAVTWEWEAGPDRFYCEGNNEILLGLSANLFEGKLEDFLRRVHPEDRPSVGLMFENALTGATLDVETRILRPNGDVHWIAVRGKSDISESLRAERVTGICWDINAKKNEENLRHERNAYEAANAAKLMFLANVSHEIRTPLAAVNGFASSILDNPELLPSVREDLNIILRNGKHLVSMVNDLLDLSKAESDPFYIQIGAMNPIQEIEDALLVAQAAAIDKGLYIDIIYDTLVPESIQGDATRFRQVIINLLTNSVKYTNQGGITLRIACESKAEECVFSVTVSDTGIGISPRTQRGLFQPFTRGDDSEVKRAAGSGLGLALSQTLARRMGGDIELVQSALGVGTSFRFTLRGGPLRGQMMVSGTHNRAVPKSAPAPRPATALDGQHILLVEDDEDLRELMQRFITKTGAVVDVATNGSEAVEKALRSPFAVILMDIKMPIMDGHRATRLLREKGYRRPIVALTASASSTDRQMCFQAGCDAYLSKPVDRNQLLEVIEKRLAPRFSERLTIISSGPTL